MTTRFIGIKEFRANISKFAVQARKKQQRLILTRNQEPVFEMRPISKKDVTLEQLMKQIKKSEEEIRQGKFYTQAQMERLVGLR